MDGALDEAMTSAATAAEGDQIVEAIADFAAGDADELTFKRGDVIHVLPGEVEPGWAKGEDSSGRIGIFPVNQTAPMSVFYSQNRGSRPGLSVGQIKWKPSWPSWRAVRRRFRTAYDRLPRWTGWPGTRHEVLG